MPLLHIRRKDQTFNRREILTIIAALRRIRDKCRKDEANRFACGMAAGYHLSAHIVWSEYENGRS